jgi:carboxyl-terminal processing protease
MVTPNLLAELRKRSAARTASSEDFKKIETDIKRFNEQKEKKAISLNREKFLAERSELTPEKQEEETFEELNDPQRPVVKRDYYFNEVLDITTDYANMLGGAPQAAALKR